jgi:hypothetical protein
VKSVGQELIFRLQFFDYKYFFDHLVAMLLREETKVSRGIDITYFKSVVWFVQPEIRGRIRCRPCLLS